MPDVGSIDLDRCREIVARSIDAKASEDVHRSDIESVGDDRADELAIDPGINVADEEGPARGGRRSIRKRARHVDVDGPYLETGSAAIDEHGVDDVAGEIGREAIDRTFGIAARERERDQEIGSHRSQDFTGRAVLVERVQIPGFYPGIPAGRIAA